MRHELILIRCFDEAPILRKAIEAHASTAAEAPDIAAPSFGRARPSIAKHQAPYEGVAARRTSPAV